ncbi:hypothetical protein PoB_001204500 [Plakobranchus ocellatus]|uniref:Uncharacterized protein n=1 Tax=Plakobranchus ocellatus TaxID=259542 RepID=A0AAV3YT02_9GAST|nr:hypothetical protein PoB_001204500 [Plakobranchus ocellatus]
MVVCPWITSRLNFVRKRISANGKNMFGSKQNSTKSCVSRVRVKLALFKGGNRQETRWRRAEVLECVTELGVLGSSGSTAGYLLRGLRSESQPDYDNIFLLP